MEVVAVDLDIATDWELSWGDELHALVDIFVLLSGKEWSLDDTRILLSWLKDRDGVIGKVERNDEPSVDILWHFSVESGGESQDLFIVVHVFKEINLWLLGDEIVDVSESIDFISKAVVWWNLNDNSISWLNWHNVTHWEVLSVSLQEVVLCEFVHTADSEASTVSNEVSIEIDLVTGQISVTNELLSWLIDVEGLWQFLSSKINRE